MSISACIICKNEEKNIKRCLDSIKDVVDEIIIVDTGSTDSTLNILNNYNCKVIKKTWTNNFSEARNIALDYATKNWILVIDCDEELEESSKFLIKDLNSSDENVEGFGVLVSNIIDNSENSNAQLRIFKNKKNYRYDGIIHEQVGDCILKVNPNALFLSTNIKFIHYGYENKEDLIKLKSERNISLLNSVAKEDRDAMYYLHLGSEYVRLNDLNTANQFFLNGYEISDKSKAYFPQLALKLVESLFMNNNFEECTLFCEDIIKYFDDFKCVYFLNGASYLNLGCYNKSLENLIKYKSTPEKPFKYPVSNYSQINNVDKIISDLTSITSL